MGFCGLNDLFEFDDETYALDRKLQLNLIASKPIERLLSECKSQALMNFKTYKQDENTYFSFSIYGQKEEMAIYIVNGCVFSNAQVKNFVYTVNNGTSFEIYTDNYITVKNNITLNEVTRLNTSRLVSMIEYVCLIITNSKETKKIIIDPDSEIYKLYSKKQIDIISFCNLALLQIRNSGFENVKKESLDFTMSLSKKI